MKMQRDDEIAVKKLGFKVGFFALLSMLTAAGAIRAEETSGAQEVRIDAVEPTVFGAGAVILLKGQGFLAEDTFSMGALKLEQIEIKPTAVRATVPHKAKAGTVLTVHRGKKKAATFTSFTFAKAPVIRKTVPLFGVPGGPMKLIGANLDTVEKMTVGETAVKIDAAEKTSLTFTIPKDLATGTLSVSGPGGTATLKKPLEVFYPPSIEKVEPSAAFPQDTVTISGKHFDTKGIRFSIGKKPVKIGKTDTLTAEKATFKVPVNAASDVVKATARKITAESASPLTVYSIPTFTPSPAAVGSPGTLKVRGKNLDVVEKWTVDGKTLEVDTTFAQTSSKLVQLKVPEDLNTSASVTATYKGRDFPAKRPTLISAAPLVGATRFATGASGKECEYTVTGKNLGEKTVFKLGKKRLKVLSATDKSAVLGIKGPCSKTDNQLVGQNGKFAGNLYSFDPAAEGYTATPEESAANLTSGKTGYTPMQIESDLTLMDGRFQGTPESFAAEGQKGGESAEQRSKIDAFSEDVGNALVRLAWGRESLCAAMAPGKHNAAANDTLGATLDLVIAKEKHLLTDVLAPLWSKLPKAAMSKGVRLDTVDSRVVLIEQNAKKKNSCAGKFYGKKLVAEAEKTTAVNLGKLHEKALTGALSNLSGKTTNAVIEEKELNDALYSFESGRRAYWLNKAKTASSKVQKGENKTVGKGVGKTKQVEKSTKQKPQTNTGKGKGK